MIQILFKLILCVLLAIAAAFAYVAMKSGDPLYAFYEWMSPARFHQYDRLIRSVALEHHLDPMLVKAVVWRESRFDPTKRGTHGERGLMQVTEVPQTNGRAKIRSPVSIRINFSNQRQIWRRAPGICIAPWNTGTISPIQLLSLWRNTMPAPARARRWSGGNGVTEIPERQFLQKIDFPATRRYVESIIDRYKFYQRRGRM